jgi:hypothetical protein
MSKWTEQKPGKAGFYFWRHSENTGLFVLEIAFVQHRLSRGGLEMRLSAIHPDGDTYAPVEFFNGQWSDAPIEPPQPADGREG